MSGWRCRPARTGRCRSEPFPDRLPRDLNHLVLTGSLLDEPREARSPRGDAITLLRLGFPVRDPERPEDLWTLARCGVEVPAAIARRSVPGLRIGAPVLAWGQLSDRGVDGYGDQHGVVVATFVRPGAPPDPPPRLFVVRRR